MEIVARLFLKIDFDVSVSSVADCMHVKNVWCNTSPLAPLVRWEGTKSDTIGRTLCPFQLPTARRHTG